ncbi:uncharacterized protein LOC144158039 [Haemaphysalis longicornis]
MSLILHHYAALALCPFQMNRIAHSWNITLSMNVGDSVHVYRVTITGRAARNLNVHVRFISYHCSGTFTASICPSSQEGQEKKSHRHVASENLWKFKLHTPNLGELFVNVNVNRVLL